MTAVTILASMVGSDYFLPLYLGGAVVIAYLVLLLLESVPEITTRRK